MATAKVAITLDENLLHEVDGLVSKGAYTNRSQAIADAVRDKVEHLFKRRLMREVAKLDPHEEQEMADELIKGETPWPEY